MRLVIALLRAASAAVVVVHSPSALEGEFVLESAIELSPGLDSSSNPKLHGISPRHVGANEPLTVTGSSLSRQQS